MSGYTLRWKTEVCGPIDGAVLRPDTLGLQDRTGMQTEKIRIGKRLYPLSEIFTVEGDPGPTLSVPGSVRYCQLGQGMTSGRLLVQGDAGDLCGMAMSGGQITIEGSAGDSLGASMNGGLIEVRGATGDRVGGPSPYATQGMTGGEILSHGSVGAQMGFRMRRGLIAAAGAGPYPGYAMLAGTLVVVAGPLEHPGVELRRGTILSLERNRPHELGSGFRFDYRTRPVILKILLGRLQTLAFPLPSGCRHGLYDLYTGDRLNLNRGEVWQWVGE